MTILPDPAVVMLHGRPTLLMHGDLLCTDDVAYQQFRAQTRDPEWQRQFLSQPLPARLAFAQQARAASQAHQSGLKAQGLMEAITDVAPATVDATLRALRHRPADPWPYASAAGACAHRAATRIVLGDWYEQGSVLRVDERHGARVL